MIPSCCTVGIYMNETSVSGRRAVMLSTGLMEILTAWSHDSFCFNFCIHTLIWAFRSLSSVASSSMQAMMTIFFRSSTNNWLTWVKMLRRLWKTGRTGYCGNRVPYFDGNPAHQLIAFCLKHIPGLLIMRVPPVILHLNQKQLSVIMNTQKVHRFGRLQGIAYLLCAKCSSYLTTVHWGD